MEHLPPVGWSHLASKDDLALTRVELREEMGELRATLRTEMAELRNEMAGLRGDVERGFRNQTWKMMTALISSNAVMVAAIGLMVNAPA